MRILSRRTHPTRSRYLGASKIASTEPTTWPAARPVKVGPAFAGTSALRPLLARCLADQHRSDGRMVPEVRRCFRANCNNDRDKHVISLRFQPPCLAWIATADSFGRGSIRGIELLYCSHARRKPLRPDSLVPPVPTKTGYFVKSTPSVPGPPS